MIRSIVEFCIDEFQRIEKYKKLIALKKGRLESMIAGFNEDEKQEFAKLTGQGVTQNDYEVEE